MTATWEQQLVDAIDLFDLLDLVDQLDCELVERGIDPDTWEAHADEPENVKRYRAGDR